MGRRTTACATITLSGASTSRLADARELGDLRVRRRACRESSRAETLGDRAGDERLDGPRDGGDRVLVAFETAFSPSAASASSMSWSYATATIGVLRGSHVNDEGDRQGTSPTRAPHRHRGRRGARVAPGPGRSSPRECGEGEQNRRDERTGHAPRGRAIWTALSHGDDADDEPVERLQVLGAGEGDAADAEGDARRDHHRERDPVEELHRDADPR